jgi:hypothetical protein
MQAVVAAPLMFLPRLMVVLVVLVVAELQVIL